MVDHLAPFYAGFFALTPARRPVSSSEGSPRGSRTSPRRPARARQQLLRHDVEHRPPLQSSEATASVRGFPPPRARRAPPNSGSTAPESTPVQKARRFDLPRLVHAGRRPPARAPRESSARRCRAPVANAPARLSPSAASANARPTAMPSGDVVQRDGREEEQKNRCAPLPPPRRRTSSSSRKRRQRAEHDARRGGQKRLADGPLPSVCSMAGRMRLHTLAAIITPAAKPSSAPCARARTPCGQKRTPSRRPAPSSET